MAESNSSGWVRQLVGAVVLALVAGGASPWWWSELKRAWQPDAPPVTSASIVQPTAAPVAPAASTPVAQPTPAPVAPPVSAAAVAPASSSQPTTREPNPEAYRAVQLIYEATKGVSQCAALAASVKNLERYTRGPRPVPDQFRQTVMYPRPKAQPTIGDLAIDRIARVKLAAPTCFP